MRSALELPSLFPASPQPLNTHTHEHTQTRVHTHARARTPRHACMHTHVHTSQVGIKEDSLFQLLTLSPWPSCSCECHRECNTGHADNNRATQVPGHSQPVALSQGEGWSRGPTPYSESPGFAGSGRQRTQGGKPLPLALPRAQAYSLSPCRPRQLVPQEAGCPRGWTPVTSSSAWGLWAGVIHGSAPKCGCRHRVSAEQGPV